MNNVNMYFVINETQKVNNMLCFLSVLQSLFSTDVIELYWACLGFLASLP